MSCLSAIARQEYYIELGNTLPEPVADTQERHELRMRTAVEAFTALKPGNAWEGRLAVDIVLSGAFAAECLRKARASSDDFAKEKCHLAQAASLKREYRAALKVLREEQRQRLATEAVAEAVAQRPYPQRPAPAPVQAAATATATATAPAAAAPAPAAAPAAAGINAPASPPAATTPPREALAAAEAFAHEHVLAAAQIRHDRRIFPATRALFPDVAFPADPAVIAALVDGSSDVLDTLDGLCDEDEDEAA